MNSGNAGQDIRRYQHRAMATIFEVMIGDADPVFAEQAAFAAFQEIDRLEQELSRYLPNSDIARINNLSPSGSARIGFDAFQCLQLAQEFWKSTRGAFDVTVGALIDCWIGRDKCLLNPSPDEVEQARKRSGMALLELDESTLEVHVRDAAPGIDLGAIGKGYAVDRAVDLLKEWGIMSALVHGGMSSVHAFGNPPGSHGWPVTLSDPVAGSEILQKVYLRNRALGGSGIRKGMHIIDPRTAQPVKGRRASWVCSDSATKGDAVSTACMILSRTEIEEYCASDPATWVVIVEGGDASGEVVRFGRPDVSWPGLS